MNRLEILHDEAVQQTKQKAMDDLDRFLGSKDTCPSYEEYITDRRHYLEQLWVNIWLNKVTNDVPRKEKKEFLREKDYEVEGVDKKLINKVFRNEMRTYQSFPLLEWLDSEIAPDKNDWNERYVQAKELFIQREEEKKQQELEKGVTERLMKEIDHLVNEHRMTAYLYIRHRIALILMDDFKNGVKYKTIDTFRLEEKLEEQGSFIPEDYSMINDFFQELTGEIHKTTHWDRGYWEYEIYFDKYEQIVFDLTSKIIPELVLNNLSVDLLHQYEVVYNDKLTHKDLKKVLAEPIYSFGDYYIEIIQEEFVVDLVKLAEIPFDESVHLEVYERDLANREIRKAEEKAALERKKQKEEQMLQDIFGREYSPSLSENIQYILHIGETNTGKTHHALRAMKEAKSGLYLSPLRLLALEVFDKLNEEGIPCNLKTGEEEKEMSGAKHISCTVEMFYEKDIFDVVVIDEAQMLADKDRGFSWYKAITQANAKEVHIIGSRNVEPMLLELLGDSNIEVHDYTRDIPLQVESKEFSLKDSRKGDAIVCFSRRKVLETASRLQSNGHSVSMIYGSMPPETRKKQMHRFSKGETNIIVATDAIGMGLNLPIRRIVFLETEKFDGTRRRRLNSQEVKQIAGRAGRKGIYNIGKVAFSKDIKIMRKLLEQQDEPVQSFAIGPTNNVFERFQKYYHDLGNFFDLWEKFESPYGTKKASLFEERELYELVRDTEIEAKLNMMDLYGFLHLPFSKKEQELTEQWLHTMFAIVDGTELPEPVIKTKNLEQQEVSYKAVGLHLLFLYRLERKTEAIYWERVREEIADGVHESLNTEISTMTKTCQRCGRALPSDFKFVVCDSCHFSRIRKKRKKYYR
jgi:ATP-dependent RNA helicase SUPV3L1/SUV3